MQHLGISPPPRASESRLRTLFWPDLRTLPAIESATDMGRLAAFVVAGLTALAGVFGFLSIWVLLDAALMALIGVAIGRKSRVASVTGLLLYALFTPLSGFSILRVLVLFVFLSATRACFAYHRKMLEVRAIEVAEAGV